MGEDAFSGNKSATKVSTKRKWLKLAICASKSEERQKKADKNRQKQTERTFKTFNNNTTVTAVVVNDDLRDDFIMPVIYISIQKIYKKITIFHNVSKISLKKC